MKLLSYIKEYKYTISLVVFSVWMLFFDGNSALFMYKQYNELKDLKTQERFLSLDITDMTRQKEELFSDDNKLEQYARENFFFKKENEDVYVIEEAVD
ncbi:MAG: septum formation initiator family protein [Bacteroidia bacterium]|jgi:cell division protein DivIC|nr:septum formation initiator family protein [Bacteroidia bacterium]